MGGLADTAGSIADVGGLLPNRVADVAHKSADWWRNEYEIPDSEAGRIGSSIGNNAVAGLAGGVVGKAVGNTYKGLKLGGEALRKRATVAAKDAEKIASNRIDYGHKFLKSIGMPSNVARGKISAADAALIRQDAYENLTKKSPYNSNESLTHNIKRLVDERAMLQRNDAEIESMFKQGIPLDEALRIQQSNWDRLPDTVRDAGLLMGIAQ